jgi:hypothetical protein
MGKPKSDKLRALKGQIKKIDTKIMDLKTTKGILDKDIQSNISRKSNFEKQIKSIENSMREPIVSDHAIVRYFERVLGVDIADVKKEILKEETHTCKRAGNTVTTIFENKNGE